jgi:hypothetical protein
MNTKDLVQDFADQTMEYPEFAAHVRRRKDGVNEDSDWGDPEPNFDRDDEPDEE